MISENDLFELLKNSVFSVIKAFLDRSSQTNVEHKTSTFSAVYKRLTGKNVVFEFPEYEL